MSTILAGCNAYIENAVRISDAADPLAQSGGAKEGATTAALVERNKISAAPMLAPREPLCPVSQFVA